MRQLVWHFQIVQQLCKIEFWPSADLKLGGTFREFVHRTLQKCWINNFRNYAYDTMLGRLFALSTEYDHCLNTMPSVEQAYLGQKT